VRTNIVNSPARFNVTILTLPKACRWRRLAVFGCLAGLTLFADAAFAVPLFSTRQRGTGIYEFWKTRGSGQVGLEQHLSLFLLSLLALYRGFTIALHRCIKSAGCGKPFSSSYCIYFFICVYSTVPLRKNFTPRSTQRTTCTFDRAF